MSPYPRLFSPITLAGKRLRNRIVHPSMTTVCGIDGRATDRLIQYHANRARGGAAMIVTEPLNAAPHQQRITTRVRIWNDDEVAGLKRWAGAVEGEDCRLIGQLQDAGRGRHAAGRNPDAIGASALPDDISWTMPHVLTVDEIAALTGHFADSAARLKRCGFSGVELSGGHGHLFHQFMSPWSNQRTDAYGGDFERRMRMMLELIARVRERCGRDFILGLKLPGDDGIPGSVDPPLAGQIARRLTQSGEVDYVCFAQGGHHRTLDMHVPDGNRDRNPYAGLLASLRSAVNPVPLMALGRITDPAEAEAIVARGEAELVGLGRALITDPAWPRKAALGQAARIRYCVSGNTCWKTIVGHQPIACDNNPRVAMPDELEEHPPARVRKRVVVVGTGVAGLEAAWVAAARGHDVAVFGRSPEVGGKTRQLATLPGGEALSSIYDFQYVEAVRAGARFELGAEARVANVLALRPDVVVLAAGSSMTWPRCLPPELRDQGLVPDLRTAMAGIAGIRQRQRGTAVIFDMDHTEGTYASAERLHALFERVVLITPRESFADDTAMVTRQGILRRIHEKGIMTLVASEPRWTGAFEAEGRLDYASIYGGSLRGIDDVAFFAYATPRAPDDGLAAPLRAAGLAVHLIGDCRVARGVLAATAEGDTVGRLI